MKCLNPVLVRSPSGMLNHVPCGKCIECLHRRRLDWSFRLLQELKVSSSACFLTLTYDDEHLPYGSDGLPTVVKSDVQLFMKRLRSRVSNGVRFFAVGEYGSKTFRPHYHILLFNVPPERLYSSVVCSWTYGNPYFGDVNEASIMYTAKYCLGYVQSFSAEQERPFMLCSRRPAIGSRFLDSLQASFIKSSLSRICVGKSGGCTLLPRYYYEKMYPKALREVINTRSRFLSYEKGSKIFTANFLYNSFAASHNQATKEESCRRARIRQLVSNISKNSKL